jgi:hypothetical protein
MISTFDLVLIGSLVSLGGLIFLFRAYRFRPGTPPEIPTVMKSRTPGPAEIHQRAEAMAGVRWLTIGALAIFIGYTRGSSSGYLFDFWSDLLFHTALLSGCWAATAFRIKRVRGTPRATPTAGAPAAPASPITPHGISG